MSNHGDTWYNLDPANIIMEHPRIVLGGEPYIIPIAASDWECDVFINLTPRGHQIAPELGRNIELHFPMRDSEDPLKLPTKAQIVEFCACAHVYARTHGTYWHCQAGINRSSLVLATYLHLYRGLSIKKAITLIRKRRSTMCLFNNLFYYALLEWWDHE